MPSLTQVLDVDQADAIFPALFGGALGPCVPGEADLADYGRWLATLDDGPTPEIGEPILTIEEWDAIEPPSR